MIYTGNSTLEYVIAEADLAGAAELSQEKLEPVGDVCYEFLRTGSTRNLVRELFQKQAVRTEADLRWRVAQLLHQVCSERPVLAGLAVHTEFPFPVKLGGRRAIRRADVVVVDNQDRVAIAVELKLVTRQDAAKDIETLRLLREQHNVQKACLCYIVDGRGRASRGRSRLVAEALAEPWARDYLHEIRYLIHHQDFIRSCKVLPAWFPDRRRR
jgi:hypothetical protein